MKIRLSSNLKHDGKVFTAGDVVDLKEDAARRLIAIGVADLANESKVKSSAKAAGGKSSGAEAEGGAGDGSGEGGEG